MLKTRNQPHLRLAFSRDEGFLEERRYAQSTSGRSDSHETLPLDSRSISIANDSPQGRSPYATLRKWPSVVRQRFAKADCSVVDGSDLRNSFSSIDTQYHHVVIGKATPLGAFTGRCTRLDNRGMKGKEKIDALADIRRANLKRLLERDYGGNRSEVARKYRDHMGRDTFRPGFISDVIRGKKSFGPALAIDLEAALNIVDGQLSIQDSPLEKRMPEPLNLPEQIKEAISALSADEQRALLREILERQKPKRRVTR